MSAWLRWSLRQLYLLYFWPTRFVQENGELDRGGIFRSWVPRLRYLLKMLPLMAVLVILTNTVLGTLWESVLLEPYYWSESWIAVMVGVAFGVALGVAFGVEGGVGWIVGFLAAVYRILEYPIMVMLGGDAPVYWQIRPPRRGGGAVIRSRGTK